MTYSLLMTGGGGTGGAGSFGAESCLIIPPGPLTGGSGSIYPESV